TVVSWCLVPILKTLASCKNTVLSSLSLLISRGVFLNPSLPSPTRTGPTINKSPSKSRPTQPTTSRSLLWAPSLPPTATTWVNAPSSPSSPAPPPAAPSPPHQTTSGARQAGSCSSSSTTVSHRT